MKISSLYRYAGYTACPYIVPDHKEKFVDNSGAHCSCIGDTRKYSWIALAKVQRDTRNPVYISKQEECLIPLNEPTWIKIIMDYYIMDIKLWIRLITGTSISCIGYV